MVGTAGMAGRDATEAEAPGRALGTGPPVTRRAGKPGRGLPLPGGVAPEVEGLPGRFTKRSPGAVVTIERPAAPSKAGAHGP